MAGTIYEKTGIDAPETGSWHQVRPFHPQRTHIPVLVDITAGTATVDIEVRNDPGDPNPAVIHTVEHSDTQPDPSVLAAFGQYRANVTAASGASIRVSLGARADNLEEET